MTADSNAQRQARHRRHVRGDHGDCGRNCPARRASGKVAELPADPGQDFDRDSKLRRLAMMLLDAYCQDPANALLAREARMTILCCPGSKDRTADDELKLLMAELARPVRPDDAE